MRHHTSENSYRKRRTRTLIQCGALIQTSGLLSCLGISPGDDLQKDEQGLPKAATLLGALLEIKTQLNENPEQQKYLWEERGKEKLAQ